MKETKDIISMALRLPREKRAEMAWQLIASLDKGTDAHVEAAWMVEVEKRLADIEAGLATTEPWEIVRERIALRLRSLRHET